jgi:16S rRNA (guanine527-N7)-methyltransferase
MSLENIFPGVPRETINRLEIYHDLLFKWNRSINLIGPTDDIWQRHIYDSAQLYSLIPDPTMKLADLGSGAGLPGLILAILGMGDVHLIESDGKKAQFLREAARLTGTSITLHDTRLETVAPAPHAIITARAFASVTNLLRWSAHLRNAETFCLFPKGKNYSIEVEEARREWSFDLDVHASRTHPDGALLFLRHIEPLHA